MEKFSQVTIRESQEKKKVKITSDLKPEIHEDIEQKWQSIITTLAKIVNVPTGLIMRLNTDSIEVFIASKTEGNPYSKGEKSELLYGLYCETVIGTQEKLLVPDALNSPIWSKDNPDVDINMISYLGIPVNWPDGEVFGTVCLLDNKENHYSQDYFDLLRQVKQHIEDDLDLLLLNEDLRRTNSELRKLNNTKTRFLSLISHDIRGNLGAISSFLHLITSDFNRYKNQNMEESLRSLSNLSSASFHALENLLRWSKSDLVDLKPEIVTVNIVEIIEEILKFFSHFILLNEILISKEYQSPDCIIQTDRNMLIVILRNVISNAIKYNEPKGKIYISVKQVDENYVISIQDTGKGMSEAKLSQLFLYDSNEDDKSEYSSGIGLILTKEFADKIGADLVVESETGKGSTFKIVLK